MATLLAVGDVQPYRDEPETLFALVREELRDADLRYCQLECAISDKGVVRTDVRNPMHRVPPKNLAALTAAGFDVVSFAGNNNLDYGIEAFMDSIRRLESAGIRVAGGGATLAEARRPVILERRGTRVAFVSACSILRDGYAASDRQPGVNPLRVTTSYEPLENIYEQPGTPARTVTICDEDDLTEVLAAIRDARREADVVVGCFHWGVHFTYDLAMYQPVVAYAAIDAGADLVFGTHPHCLQAIDVYKGKPIFYSLGNFAFEQPADLAHRGVSEYLSFYGIAIDRSVPGYAHPRHCRDTVLVRCEVTRDGVGSVQVIPAYFSDTAQPMVVHPGSADYKRVSGLLIRQSKELGTRLREDDGRLLLDLEKEHAVDTRTLVRRRKLSYPSLQILASHSS